MTIKSYLFSGTDGARIVAKPGDLLSVGLDHRGNMSIKVEDKNMATFTTENANGDISAIMVNPDIKLPTPLLSRDRLIQLAATTNHSAMPSPFMASWVKQLGRMLDATKTSAMRILPMLIAYEQTPSLVPAWPSEADFRLRVRLQVEEFFETMLGYHDGDMIEVIDGIADCDVVNVGSALFFGVDYDRVLEHVQASNMSKLGEDGRPIKDAGGKTTKGPGFWKPNLKQFVGDLPPPPYDHKKITREVLWSALTSDKFNRLFGDMIPGLNLAAPEEGHDIN